MARDVGGSAAERSAVQLNRFVQVVLPMPDDREPIERFGKLGLQRERLPECALGPAVVLLDEQDPSDVVVAAGGGI